MFYLKSGPWEQLNLKNIGNVSLMTGNILDICRNLPDISGNDLYVYVAWLASELVSFSSQGTDELELLDVKDKKYLGFFTKNYILTQDRDMACDVKEDVSIKLKRTKKKK